MKGSTVVGKFIVKDGIFRILKTAYSQDMEQENLGWKKEDEKDDEKDDKK